MMKVLLLIAVSEDLAVMPRTPTPQITRHLVEDLQGAA